MSQPFILHCTLLIMISAAATFFLRALPFWVFGGKRTMPAALSSAAGAMPPSIIAVLVIYCLKDAVIAADASLIFSLISLAVTVGIHLWRRSTLLSVFAGTAVYMLLIHIL